MARVKIKLADNISRVVFIESDATKGATIGKDLMLPNGDIATKTTLADYLGVTSDADVPQPAHRLLAGLALGDDHPQYTRKDTLTTRGDLYVRGATTVRRLAIGSDKQVLRSNGTDPLWTTLSPVVTLSTDLSGNTTLTDLGNAALAATIVAHAVTDGKIRQSSGLSVIGRSANTTGDVADITAASDGDVLRRSGTTLGFGAIPESSVTNLTTDLAAKALKTTSIVAGTGLTGGGDLSTDRTLNVGAGTGITVNADDVAITTNGVTNALFRQSAALTVVGRAANSTGDVSDIAASADDQILRRTGSALSFGQLAVGMFPDDVVTYAKIQNVSATSRVLGRITAGAGDIEELTGANLATIIGTSLAANPTASVGLTAVNGSASTYMRSDAAPALDVSISPTWSGTHTFNNTPVVPAASWTYAKIQDVSATSRILGRRTAGAGVIEELTLSQLLDLVGSAADGDILYRTAGAWARLPIGSSTNVLTVTAGLPVWAAASGGGGGTPANPTASVGLTAVNGVASTYMRSDAAPPLDVSIAPTWTGIHTWSSAEPRLLFNESDAGTNLKLWDIDVNSSVFRIRTRTDADGAGVDALSVVRGTTTTFKSVYVGATGLTLGTNDAGLLLANNGAANIDAHSQDQNAKMRMRRYNTSMLSGPTEIQTSNVLGQLIFQGYSSNATAIRSTAVVAATASETWTSTAAGTKMSFTTTINGNSSASISLTLQGDQAQAEDGLVTAPSWTFRNDLDCGMYRIGTNNVGVAVNGAKVLDVSTTGLGVTGTVVATGAISGTNLSATGGANPSASAGLTAINGSAITFMRSDAAPAIDVAITPTWTGTHTFANINTTFSHASAFFLLGGTNPLLQPYFQASSDHLYFGTRDHGRFQIKVGGQIRLIPLTADPTDTVEDGDMYYNSSTNKLRLRAAGAWVSLN